MGTMSISKYSTVRRALRLAVLIALASLLATGLGACAGSKVEQLDQQTKSVKNDINDLRTLQAQQSSAINEIRADLRALQGKIEELQHASVGKTQELEQTISQLKSRVPPPPGVPEDLLNADEEKIGGITGPAADQYRKALGEVRAGGFESARQTLSSFVEGNPGTAFTDNALFWLGITYDKLGQYDRAIVSYSEVFQKYPAEDMVAPALFFLAESFMKLGSKSDAVLTLQKLVDEHGSSAYGARGRARLQELQPGGAKKRR